MNQVISIYKVISKLVFTLPLICVTTHLGKVSHFNILFSIFIQNEQFWDQVNVENKYIHSALLSSILSHIQKQEMFLKHLYPHPTLGTYAKKINLNCKKLNLCKKIN